MVRTKNKTLYILTGILAALLFIASIIIHRIPYLDIPTITNTKAILYTSAGMGFLVIGVMSCIFFSRLFSINKKTLWIISAVLYIIPVIAGTACLFLHSITDSYRAYLFMGRGYYVPYYLILSMLLVILTLYGNKFSDKGSLISVVLAFIPIGLSIYLGNFEIAAILLVVFTVFSVAASLDNKIHWMWILVLWITAIVTAITFFHIVYPEKSFSDKLIMMFTGGATGEQSRYYLNLLEFVFERMEKHSELAFVLITAAYLSLVAFLSIISVKMTKSGFARAYVLSVAVFMLLRIVTAYIGYFLVQNTALLPFEGGITGCIDLAIIYSSISLSYKSNGRLRSKS